LYKIDSEIQLVWLAATYIYTQFYPFSFISLNYMIATYFCKCHG